MMFTCGQVTHFTLRTALVTKEAMQVEYQSSSVVGSKGSQVLGQHCFVVFLLHFGQSW